MADNVQASAVTGSGPVFASDDIGGVNYPIGKLAFGALDTATLVTATVGLPTAPVSAVASAIADHNQVTVGASAVQINASSVALSWGVTVKADDANSGTVYVGKSGVTTSTGFPLGAGQSIDIPVANVNAVYVIASGAGQHIAYLGI